MKRLYLSDVHWTDNWASGPDMVQNPRDRLEVCYTASVGQMWPKCHNDTCPSYGVNTLSQGQMCRCEPHLAISRTWVAITHHATVLSWNTTDNKLPGNMSLAFISRNSFCLLRPGCILLIRVVWLFFYPSCQHEVLTGQIATRFSRRK